MGPNICAAYFPIDTKNLISFDCEVLFEQILRFKSDFLPTKYSSTKGFVPYIPEPAEMLQQSDVVVVAKLNNNNGIWSLHLTQIIKGNFKPKETFTFRSNWSENRFTYEGFSKMVGHEDFLFLGHFEPETHSIHPNFARWGVWPQGNEDFQGKTLSEVINFAKKELNLPPTSTGQSSATSQQASHSTVSQTPGAFFSSPYVATGWIGWCLVALGVICLAWLFRWLRKP